LLTYYISFVPETKGLELEELDAVFETPTWVSASFYWREGKWWVRRYILHQRGHTKPKLQRSVEEEVEMGPMRRRTTHHTIPD